MSQCIVYKKDWSYIRDKVFNDKKVNLFIGMVQNSVNRLLFNCIGQMLPRL